MRYLVLISNFSSFLNQNLKTATYFLSKRQLKQNQSLPGTLFMPMQVVWNHLITHKLLSHSIILPNDDRRQIHQAFAILFALFLLFSSLTSCWLMRWSPLLLLFSLLTSFWFPKSSPLLLLFSLLITFWLTIFSSRFLLFRSSLKQYKRTWEFFLYFCYHASIEDYFEAK